MQVSSSCSDPFLAMGAYYVVKKGITEVDYLVVTNNSDTLSLMDESDLSAAGESGARRYLVLS